MSLKSRLQAAPNEEASLNLLIEGAQLQLNGDRIETKKALATAKSELEQARTTLPYSTGNIIRCKLKVESIEAGLQALDELEAEDFPAEQKTLK